MINLFLLLVPIWIVIIYEETLNKIKIEYNVWRLGVCYIALQTFKPLDKIYRQNNSTKPLLVAGAVN
jgi:hypothetical protein